MKNVRDKPLECEGVVIHQCSDCGTDLEVCCEEMKRTCPFHNLQKKDPEES